MSGPGRTGLVGLGSVAAPVVIFLVLKATIGLGPSPSPAQVTDADPGSGTGAAATGSAPAPTTEQARAIAWLKTLTVEADMPSPLEQPEARAVPEPVPAASAPDPFDDLRLSALLSTTDGGMATINGRVCRVGDTAEGFVVRSIDTRGQRVEVVGSDGRARWLSRHE